MQMPSGKWALWHYTERTAEWFKINMSYRCSISQTSIIKCHFSFGETPIARNELLLYSWQHAIILLTVTLTNELPVCIYLLPYILLSHDLHSPPPVGSCDPSGKALVSCLQDCKVKMTEAKCGCKPFWVALEGKRLYRIKCTNNPNHQKNPV